MHWRSLLYARRFRRPRAYHLNFRVHRPTPPKESVLLLPYPKSTANQTVHDVHFRSDGSSERHEEFILASHATFIEITCDVDVRPRHAEVPHDIPVHDNALPPELAYYIQPDHFIHSNDERIQARAQELRADEHHLIALTKKLYEHSVEHLHYGDPIVGLYTTHDVFTRPAVDCGGFATYLAALLRACRIPCRVLTGFWTKPTSRKNSSLMHAWLEYLLPNGEWVALDPSIDHLRRHHRTFRVASYNDILSDRIVTGIGSDHHVHIGGRDYVIGILQAPLLLHANGRFEHCEEYSFIAR